MIKLYLDSSSKDLVIGIQKDGINTLIKKELSQDMSKLFIPILKEELDKLDIKPNQIDEIITNIGPGSFTGTRIANTIAKTISYSFNIPIKTVTSLYQANISSNSKGIIAPIILDRNSNVYASIYNNDEVILKESYINIDEFYNILNNYKEVTIILSQNDLETIDKKEEYNYELISVDLDKIFNGNLKEENVHKVEPLYIKNVSINKRN